VREAGKIRELVTVSVGADEAGVDVELAEPEPTTPKPA
jgi:hypothetical protein